MNEQIDIPILDEPSTPDFATLIDELHSRPYPEINAPAMVSHFSVLNADTDIDQEVAHLEALAEQFGISVSLQHPNFFYGKFGGVHLRWERHTEYSSYTFIAASQGQKPFQTRVVDLLPDQWVAGIKGKQIAALDVELVVDELYAQDNQTLRLLFEEQRLFGAKVIDERAILWTAVRVHEGGVGRALIFNGDLVGPELGRLLRSVLELDTYRNLALIALPLARAMLPEVKRLETQLAGIIERIPEIETLEQEQQTLHDLSNAAALVERMISNMTYRFSATAAYAEMVAKRLQALAETPIRGITTVSAFMNWRFQPGVQTCASVSNRLLILSRRIVRATDLLRTRVDLSIQVQNQALLKSMDERSKLSLYIQRSVEGLSVIVITYYLITLFEKIAKTTNRLPFEVDVDLIVAGLIPVILLLVWFGVRSIKKRVDKLSNQLEERTGD